VFKFLFPVLIIMSLSVQAEDSGALNVDREVSTSEFSFPNRSGISPRISDFKVEDYVLMSNDSGERWGVITLTNLSSGHREFDSSQLVALFADGESANPLAYESNFSGRETQSITVSFGEHKFPILSIYSNN
jgi:hypothetical protein